MRKSIILPGNHDINIVDKKRLWRVERGSKEGRNIRLCRMLSAMDLVQGNTALLLTERGELKSLRAHLAQYRDDLIAYADTGSTGFKTNHPTEIWDDAFPQVIPLENCKTCFYVLDSNIIATSIIDNAFGVVSHQQIVKLGALMKHFDGWRSVICIHHHLALPHWLSSWSAQERLFERFMVLQNNRQLIDALITKECVVLHGHRHVNYQGQLGRIQVVSAPSTTLVDAATGYGPCFHMIDLNTTDNDGVAVSSSIRKDLI
jgi:hypothetical protein